MTKPITSDDLQRIVVNMNPNDTWRMIKKLRRHKNIKIYESDGGQCAMQHESKGSDDTCNSFTQRNTCNTEEMICPHCGDRDYDNMDETDCSEVQTCSNCGKDYKVTIKTVYTTGVL